MGAEEKPPEGLPEPEPVDEKDAKMASVIRGVAIAGAGLGAVCAAAGGVFILPTVLLPRPTMGATPSAQIQWQKRQAEMTAQIAEAKATPFERASHDRPAKW